MPIHYVIKTDGLYLEGLEEGIEKGMKKGLEKTLTFTAKKRFYGCYNPANTKCYM